MRLVAVSQRIDYFASRKETRDGIDQRLVKFLLAAGFLAVPVPNSIRRHGSNGLYDFKDLSNWLAQVNPSGYVLSGGNDIGEYPERDQTEFSLLEYAKSAGTPVLGICRGMQLMASWFGTKLRPAEGHVGCRHFVSGEISREVNSFHSFVIESCPDGFIVVGSSEDQEIEAMRHRHMPWEGWMWHPEREEEFSTSDITRLQRLFNQR